MTVVLCWAVYPVLLALVSAGLGLLGEWMGRFRLPTSLLLPFGFALLVAVTTLLTLDGQGTARLATPAVIVLAVAGSALGARGREWRVSRWGVFAALGVFAVAAAPVVLSGKADFAGYTQLDDISTFLAFAARAVEHGRDLSGLQPSTYEATLALNFGSGYPLGAFVPLSATGWLAGQDLAWLWQPYLTFVLVMLALSLWALARPVVRDERLRAVAVFIAAQPALLYAYALQGGVKELATAALIAFAAAVGAELVGRSSQRWRLLAPLAVAAGALLCVLSAGAIAYMAPLAIALAVALLGPALAEPGRRRRAVEVVRTRAVAIGVAVAFLAVALVVAASSTSGFLPGAQSLLQNKTDIGNLFHPLDWKQVFGVWPAGDFRNGIGQGRTIAWVLLAVLAAAGVVGVVWTARRRMAGPLLLGAAALVALVGLSTYGSSPWVEAKALAIASPAVVLFAVLGAALLIETRRLRVVGALALAAIAGGVLWSNWLAYRDVKLAPRDRLAELVRIGHRFAGQGPALINEYEPYGARYFLRRLDPEAPAELRRRVVPLRTGQGLGKNQWAPIDEFLLEPVLVYRTIVIRRSPAESRPPAEYRLRFSGRYYDVWQRDAPPRPRVLPYSIFGDNQNAGALPPCGLVRQLAASAGKEGAALAAAVRAPAVIADLSGASKPAGWAMSAGPPAHIYPRGAGTAVLRMSVPRAGEYDVWVQGSFSRGIEVSVDGARVGGDARDERSFSGQWIRFGVRRLTAGSHEVSLHYPSGSAAPGTGQQPETVGPVAL
ncbi:MAG: hypothetical protein QOJ57_1819, partial [Thermoleophilaceae bacterium]|nr:hypothetical protein [Thermoleophilaceae bacterium]